MVSKVDKGTTETLMNDSSTTFVWILRNGSWSRYLSPDRLWNWFRNEYHVESPLFSVVDDGCGIKFRLGLKDPPGLSSIIAYAKLDAPLPDGINPYWEVLIDDGSNRVALGHRHRNGYTQSTGKSTKHFLAIEFVREPPVDISLTIRLTFLKSSQWKRGSWIGGMKKNDSIFSTSSLDNAPNLWRANLGRMLSTSSDKSRNDDESGDYHFDVTLIVEEEVFYAHRSVLTCHSSVFSAMFRKSNNFKESRQREVVIEDITADTMCFLLQYLYTGEVQKTDGSPDSKMPYQDLLVASEKYDLKGLKRLCESKLIKEITMDNVCELIALADTYRASTLKSECIRYMKGRGAGIGMSDAFVKLARQSSALFKEVFSKLW